MAAVILAGCELIAACAQSARADAATGLVASADGQPVAGAVVRLQGTTMSTLSGADGRFRLAAPAASAARYLTAWKDGYYIGGVPLAADGTPFHIALKPLPTGDNADYQWLAARSAAAPANDSGKPCETCHLREVFPLVPEWESSAHARAATNPFFLAFFNGGQHDLALLPQLGYKRDFPRSSGNCANCHLPALALRRPYDADPGLATGVERDGVFCDLCHKVRQVKVDTVGGRAGVLAMSFARPPHGEQLFLGPFDDVFPGPDTFHPLYKDSRFCAACHHGVLWGVLAYGEFAEWQASSYAEKGIQCQSCHMKPDGKTLQVAPTAEGAIVRHPDTIASHAFPGRDDAQFMRSALQVDADARIEASGDKLQVTVKLRNTGAGHHVPTGNPMRNLVLLVDARDASGRPLELLEGSSVPIWGGQGRVEFGNFAGLPGKGYAKILSTPVAYPADSHLDEGRPPLYPAPHWRRIRIESDNRLPAGGEDASEYLFRLPPGSKQADVRVRLLHRRTFRSWLDPRVLPEPDLLLAEQVFSLR